MRRGDSSALFVKEALGRGDNVAAAARNPQIIAEGFGARSNLLAIKLDVTNEEQAREAVRQTVERFGRIDVLINYAGFGVLGAVEEISGTEVEAVYRTNVFGLLSVTRAALPQLRHQGSGHIINISAVAGYRAMCLSCSFVCLLAELVQIYFWSLTYSALACW